MNKMNNEFLFFVVASCPVINRFGCLAPLYGQEVIMYVYIIDNISTPENMGTYVWMLSIRSEIPGAGSHERTACALYMDVIA